MKKFLLSITAVTAALCSYAHEGHGHTHGYTIKHYFSEPVHVVFLLAVAGGIWLLVTCWRKYVVKK
jgi:hypothetical protein